MQNLNFKSAVLVALGVSAGMLMSACSLGPAFHHPIDPAPRAWVMTPGPTPGAIAHAAAPAWPKPGWWHGFGSEPLDRYIAAAQTHNQDIAAAIAQVHEADADARIAGAPLLPSVALQATASRQKSFSPFSGTTSAAHTEYAPLLTASYELDFWGRNRSLRRAAVAELRASRYNRHAVALTVVTSVALTYFQSLELRDRLRVAQDNWSNAQHVLDDIELEARVGTATALDVAQQAATVAALRAAIPPLRQQLRAAEDALAVLVGSPPQALTVGSGSLVDLKEPPVYPGLPAALLARRPDVAAAESRLRAANANIAAARAAIFPSLTLTGSAGYAGAAAASVFAPADRVYGATATLVQDIFEGGAMRGAYEYSQARYAELLAEYRKSVLTAFANVQDAIAELQQTAVQEKRERTVVKTASLAFDFAQRQMRTGVTNVLVVLNTESALFAAQDTLVQVKYAHLRALVDLYAALGGGWSPPGSSAAKTGVHQ